MDISVKKAEVRTYAISIALFVGIALCCIGKQQYFDFPYQAKFTLTGSILIAFIITYAVLLLVVYLAKHGLFKGGFKYFNQHRKLFKRINTQLLDDKVYIERYCFNELCAVLPKVKIKFDNNLLTGEVSIENTLRYKEKLIDVDISCCLLNYIVEQSYISSDGNYVTYDIFDADFDRQLVFENTEQFLQSCKQVGDYELFIDKVTTVDLFHSMISGQSGSGKSYSIFTIIAQMLNKPVHFNLYFADPKASGMASLGKAIDETRTADSIDGIIELLRSFHAELVKRKELMENSLTNSKNIDSDYRNFGYEPFVFVFDEYLAFGLALQNYKKDIRDEIASILSDIVLMGRQLGFFLFLIMQSAPANNIPTIIRDQLAFKVVLGNSDDSTYTVAFGAGVDIPIRKYPIGYGVYTYAGKTEKPKILAFPTIKDFDIMTVIDKYKSMGLI